MFMFIDVYWLDITFSLYEKLHLCFGCIKGTKETYKGTDSICAIVGLSINYSQSKGPRLGVLQLRRDRDSQFSYNIVQLNVDEQL